MKVLLVEDDPRVTDFLDRGLRAEGYSVTCARTGPDGLAMACKQVFAVIVLDVMLPGMNGLDVCQTLRARGVFTPVLILTARDSTRDRVEGFNVGADDYLCKPFAFDELIARLSALIRRARGFQNRPKIAIVGDIVMDRETHVVRRGDDSIELTAKELAILDLLMSSPGKVFSREKILSSVWNCDEDPLTNVVEVYIARLRKKLEKGGKPSLIKNLRGVGYKLEADAM